MARSRTKSVRSVVTLSSSRALAVKRAPEAKVTDGAADDLFAAAMDRRVGGKSVSGSIGS